MSRSKPIAVLGVGPAGLLAAHALALREEPFVLLAKNPAPSHISGAQFLHEPIPLATADEPDDHITYKVRGTPEQYAEKVYGSFTKQRRPKNVSILNIKDGELQPAWTLRGTYQALWDAYGLLAQHAEIDAEWINDNGDEFAAIISSIPAPALCLYEAGLSDTPHSFDSQPIVLADKAMNCPPQTVIYDARPDVSWYRTSMLWGEGGTEWSGVTPPIPDLRTGVKPVRHNCDCSPEIIRVGRFGKWQKNQLAHHAFQDVLTAEFRDL